MSRGFGGGQGVEILPGVDFSQEVWSREEKGQRARKKGRSIEDMSRKGSTDSAAREDGPCLPCAV